MKAKNAQLIVVVLITMVVIVSMGLALLYSHRSRVEINEISFDRTQAQLASGTGIDIAKLKLSDACAVWGGTNFTLGGANVTVTVTDLGTKYGVSSQAIKGKTRQLNTANVTKPTVKEWARAYGTISTDIPYSLQQTSDGGYALGGYTAYTASPYDEFLLIKTDPQGNSVWNKTYGGSSTDRLRSLQQTQDNGYILGGRTMSFGKDWGGNYNFLVIKTNSQGEVGPSLPGTWAKTYGNNTSSAALYFGSLQQTSDGGYILGGYTNFFGARSDDFLVIKTDRNGEVNGGDCGVTSTCWAKLYGGNSTDQLTSLQQTSDGYILGGYTGSFGAGIYSNFLVIKTDKSGNVTSGDCGTNSTCWAKTYDTSDVDSLFSLQQTSDGGYILGGTTAPSFFSSNFHLLVIKTNSQGEIGSAFPGTWAEKLSGTNSESLSSIKQTQDLGYIMGGSTNSFDPDANYNFLAIKTNSQGNKEWAKAYGGSYDDSLHYINQVQNGYILGGDTNSFRASGSYDVFAIKTDLSGNLDCCPIYQDVTANVTVNNITSDPNFNMTEVSTHPNFNITDIATDPNFNVTDVTNLAEFNHDNATLSFNTTCPQLP